MVFLTKSLAEDSKEASFVESGQNEVKNYISKAKAKKLDFPLLETEKL